MGTRTVMATVCLLCLADLCMIRGQEKPRPPVAPQNQEPGGRAKEGKKTAYNTWTGDARIRLRRFHAILFLPATGPDELQDAGRTKDKILDLTDSFSTDYVDRAGKAVNFFQQAAAQNEPSAALLKRFNFKATPEPYVLWNKGAKKATWKNLADEVRALDIREEDVVFVWIQTHGQASGKAGGATLFDAESTPIDRNALRGTFKTRAGAVPWLTVFITDRCSIPPPKTEQALPTEGDGKMAQRSIWRSLYFGHKGMVDIDSSSPNEFAVIDGGGGSIFVRAFRDVLDEKIVPYEEINKDMDPVITWDKEFLEALQRQTDKHFKAAITQARRIDADFLKGQATQTPRIDFSNVQVNERREAEACRGQTASESA